MTRYTVKVKADIPYTPCLDLAIDTNYTYLKMTTGDYIVYYYLVITTRRTWLQTIGRLIRRINESSQTLHIPPPLIGQDLHIKQVAPDTLYWIGQQRRKWPLADISGPLEPQYRQRWEDIQPLQDPIEPLENSDIEE